MYRVTITNGQDKPVERVFVAPYDVRQFVRSAYWQAIDTEELTERMLCMLHQKGGCVERDGLKIAWEE